MNFFTGVAADTFGRKWCVVLGWVLFIPMPLMVIFAEDWWTVATSNIFLGVQQSLVRNRPNPFSRPMRRALGLS